MSRPLVLTERAQEDIGEAVDHYRDTASEQLTPLLDAFARALAQIEQTPGTGSQRYAETMAIEGLRCRATGKFPYLVFYVSRGPHVVVLRVLHQHRDLESAFGD